jgi:hypothetical protein
VRAEAYLPGCAPAIVAGNPKNLSGRSDESPLDMNVKRITGECLVGGKRYIDDLESAHIHSNLGKTGIFE